MIMIRIYFEDRSHIDFFASETQLEDFCNWLRFANRDDVFVLPGEEQTITRRNVVRIEWVDG
ncbi:MAG: hypothetical protein IJV40_13960 [Oscillospiraceae bacterium]|nr:hypothetical protein [Oscillospiraceae bacterium]